MIIQIKGHAQTASNGMQFGSRPNSRDAYPSRPNGMRAGNNPAQALQPIFTTSSRLSNQVYI
jgi:hypothetical protein